MPNTGTMLSLCGMTPVRAMFSQIFYLLDTRSDKPFPMEVFGMSTPAYLARKELKKAYYNPGIWGLWMVALGCYGEDWIPGTPSFRKLDDKINLNHNLKIGLKWRTYFRWVSRLNWRRFWRQYSMTTNWELFPQQQAVGGITSFGWCYWDQWFGENQPNAVGRT